MNKVYIDSGNDWNEDNHCDLDGWFVDKDGHHRPIIRRIKTESEIKIASPKFLSLDIASYFDINGTIGNVELSPLYIYTLDDENIDLSSPNLNRYLRGHENNDEQKDKRIRELDYLINSSKTKKPINVYRGMTLDYNKGYIKKILKLKSGDIYSDNGFMSTSHSQEIAVKYAMKNGNNIVFFDISLDKGTKAFPLFKENGSSEKQEYEVLLKRNQKFVVEKITASDKENIIVYIKLRSVNK